MTITIEGRTLDAARCSICRALMYPPALLPAHEQKHREMNERIARDAFLINHSRIDGLEHYEAAKLAGYPIYAKHRKRKRAERAYPSLTGK